MQASVIKSEGMEMFMGCKFAQFFIAVDHHKFIKCIQFFLFVLSNILTKQRETNETKYEREKKRDKNTRT